MRIFKNCFGGYFVCLFFRNEKDFGFVDLESEPTERLGWEIQNRVGVIDGATFQLQRWEGGLEPRAPGLALSRNRSMSSSEDEGRRQGNASILVRVG